MATFDGRQARFQVKLLLMKGGSIEYYSSVPPSPITFQLAVITIFVSFEIQSYQRHWYFCVSVTLVCIDSNCTEKEKSCLFDSTASLSVVLMFLKIPSFRTLSRSLLANTHAGCKWLV